MTGANLLSDYLTQDQLAEALGVVPRTLRRYQNEPNGLPFTTIGGRRLYRLESVQRWLERREHQPNPTRARRAPGP